LRGLLYNPPENSKKWDVVLLGMSIHCLEQTGLLNVYQGD
jgi:hypothetical protein